MEKLIHYLPQLFLGVIALIFIGFGVLGWINPVGTVAPLDIPVNAAQAKTEIRATYGGFMVGVGLLLAYAAFQPSMIRFGLIAIILMLFTIGFTRLYGIVFDGTRAGLQWQLLAMELVPAILAFLILLFHPLKPGIE